MKPGLNILHTACPDIDKRLLQEHLNRLDERYFNRFNLETIAQHIRSLSKLSTENPVEILLHIKQEQVELTILAFDYPSEFALITGLMTGLGMDIQSGGIHTYAQVHLRETLRSQRRAPYVYRKDQADPWARRRIVDHFIGTLATDLPAGAWHQEFMIQMKGLFVLLEKGGEQEMALAKHRVNEKVARRLETLQHHHPVLFPVEIHIDNKSGPFTRLGIISQDTPGFLYSISNALSLKGISIEHVRINTVDNRIEDIIDFVDNKGKQITDTAALDQIKLSVLITKQFTYFLGSAPDPYAALSRFEKLVEDILQLPQHGRWVELLSEPSILRELAQLLGTSDFLWEDMIRLQYETLLPMLAPHVEERRFAEDVETLPDRLEMALAGASGLEEQCQRLNAFKDREIFLIDLDYILTPGADFKTLAEYLTYLATVIIRKAARINFDAMAERFGRPRTVAGLEAQYAILGLGKFGGADLGYASDIELLFVYSDNGQTDGGLVLTNAEFYEQLVQNTAKFIHAKREGIFNIDLRLRPYGKDGPLACSLENFCNYYGSQGPAMSYERLALVRLRSVGGDADLGSRLERLRDEFIYTANTIRFEELRELRSKQFEEKTRGGKLNAKFSPGALVDLEYDVQVLQVMYGKDNSKLRTPRIHQALEGLCEAGVLAEDELQALNEAYNFLRRLINGLRMLRGSAQDLFLPPIGSDEYLHLARRMGYAHVSETSLDPGQQLYLEFETRTAAIRVFVERHFGRESLPGAAAGNVADVILSDQVSLQLRQGILGGYGLQDPERAYVNLRKLAGDAGQRLEFARLAILACDSLRLTPDPDMALNNWERFVQALPDPRRHFEMLSSQPMRLEILLKLFSSSQFLANVLVRNPEFLDWVTDPRNLRRPREHRDHADELVKMRAAHEGEREWLNALRRYRRREMLRIGTRDIALQASLAEVVHDLSNLADTLIQMVLDRSWEVLRAAGKIPAAASGDPAQYYCILALGKLGGRELNYSSDIDLLGVCAEHAGSWRQRLAQELGKDPFALVMENTRAYLAQYTEEGNMYRVDLRLRPYGAEGLLIPSIDHLVHYYQTTATLGEIQALLKIRPVAGNLQLGNALCEQLRFLLLTERDPRLVVQSIEKMRSLAMKQNQRNQQVMDVKSGLGGLRDIEFMVQGMQMIHAAAYPDIVEGNTLTALEHLGQTGILDNRTAVQMQEDYIFLRRVEHFLQILEDQQIHALPQNQGELASLGKRVMGIETNAGQFLTVLNETLERVHNIYKMHFIEKYG
ncbi:glutamate-ammonia-ligase adenylyltransferase [candidate division FCPU426 bacterium]|nr:glutamate-ammonia-ligase adenylyltransferase [candidate division FCPU426 bacterium]